MKLAMATLYLVCGGAPPTKDVHRIVPIVQVSGWDVWVVPSPQGLAFLDAGAMEDLTGHPVRAEFRRPDEGRLPLPDAILAAPLTFNSVNKLAAGIADTFALGVLTEALGEHQPVVVVPWAKPALTSHPAFGQSVELLRSMGARFVLGDAGLGPVDENLTVSEFPWAAALAALSELVERHPSPRPGET
jgi:phosphopantothenoylcysteine synthetase/decarboxylase